MSSAALPAPSASIPAVSAGVHPRRWAVASVLLVAFFMNIADVTIVNVALPSIQVGLGATSTQLQWVSAAYLLPFAALLLPFGRFGDTLGRRRVFLLGLAGFTGASLLCGLAPSAEALIAARALQGAAAAMMVPQVLAIIHVIFPPEEKAQALQLTFVVGSAASVAGPLAGGLLLGLDAWSTGWRSVFLINVPLGLVALLAGARLLPGDGARGGIGGRSVDGLGVALSGAVMVLLVLPLVEGRSWGWPWWGWVMMVLALVLAVIFALWERRQASRGFAQLLPAALLGRPSFLRGLALVTLFFSGIPGLFLVLALLLQSGLGLTPLASGLTTLPFPLGVMASVVLARWVTGESTGRVVLGALLLAGGMGTLLVSLRVAGGAIAPLGLLPSLFAAGVGMGLAASALFGAVLATVPAESAGAGSGALQAMQQLGSVLGIALVGQIFFARLGEESGSDAYAAAGAAAAAYPAAIYAVLALGLLATRRPVRTQA
ncbi:MFS transporter [Rubellimicrobium rubrum]|uniref:MFS transporter n=1 Tax=Rubellimicrobium rubrum TaxID=2585369 RepID=A0A5C4MV56_9RHOB|nr:MFS transporter [Rubellimicrobium rubrum]TNC47701.1 MFS transporter [Rubellimicrobium rubrum]